MKRFIYFTVFFILLFVFSIFMIIPDQMAQTTKDLSGSTMRAAKGDTVWVLLNHIKADKCEQFEKFVHEILWPIALESDLISQQAGNHTRVLHPLKMNEDSTYTYVFIMDPVIQDANYQFSYYLKKKYDEEKTKEYLNMVSDCYATPQTGYTVVQSQH
jgi:hypothetical protein